MKDIISNKVGGFIQRMIGGVREVIDSTEALTTEGTPFGQGVKQCLVKAFEILKSLGFETKNIDGYMDYAQHGERGLWRFLRILQFTSFLPQ